MPGDAIFKFLNSSHQALLKASGGRLGWSAGKMPVVELTTTGRKTGERRTVLLTSPVQPGGSVVLIASRWGDEHHPAWFLNLSTNPEVEVARKGASSQRMRARVAVGDERAQLWAKAVERYPRYAAYQRKTSREIPVVVLDPVEP